MRIEQLMSMPVITCSSEDSLDHAANLMWVHDIGVVAVVDRYGHLCGMLTDRDICMAAHLQGKGLSQIQASDVMAQRVFTCHPEDSVESVECVMRERQVRRMPVVNSEGGLMGLVSLNDLTRHAAHLRQGTAQEHDVVQTLAAICEPRGRSTRSVAVVAKPENNTFSFAAAV